MAYGHILWHFALSLYVKMGGKPWALARQINNVNCLIGIGFGKAKQEKNSIYVGIANIFDSHGQWLSFTSEDKELNAEEVASLENREFGVATTSSYKLHKDLTYKIAKGSLSVYVQSSTSAIPTMVVLHKNGKMYEFEALGFLQALSEFVLDGGQKLSSTKFALVSIIKNHDLRVYGPDNINESLPIQNTVSRGAVHLINENTAVVATTGKNQSYYPGIGTPRPLILERFCPSDETLKVAGFDKAQMYSIEEICDQVLSLTKLHWGTTRSIRLPITSEYAQRIARFVARSQVRVELLLKLKKLWWV